LQNGQIDAEFPGQLTARHAQHAESFLDRFVPKVLE
jgi:hypothetical protein